VKLELIPTRRFWQEIRERTNGYFPIIVITIINKSFLFLLVCSVYFDPFMNLVLLLGLSFTMFSVTVYGVPPSVPLSSLT